MKKFLKQFSQILGMQTVLLVATAVEVHSAPQSASPTIGTNSGPAEVSVQKSIFVDNLKSGRDPFYPRSIRRSEREPVLDAKTAAPIVQLFLKGISGPANRRFALINNQPLAAGEDAYVRISGGQVKVHCWEIREDSVVISVEGDPERKELRLREGL